MKTGLYFSKADFLFQNNQLSDFFEGFARFPADPQPLVTSGIAPDPTHLPANPGPPFLLRWPEPSRLPYGVVLPALGGSVA